MVRQWLKSTIVEPNGIRNNPKGRGTPQGGVISPLLSNIYLHWFETCATLVAKGMNQVMPIVRYADDIPLGRERPFPKYELARNALALNCADRLR